MKIVELKPILEKIFTFIDNIIGKNSLYEVSPIINAANFFEDLIDVNGKEKIGLNDRDGLYVFSKKECGKILYVGISTNVVDRFSQHVGSGFSWSRNGNIAKFPNCRLVFGKEEWLDKEIKEIFENAKFDVTFIIPNDKKCKALIEQYLIYYASAVPGQEPIPINVN